MSTIQRSVVDGDVLHPGATGIYGHRLLGALNQVRSGGSTREMGNVQDSTWCGTDWTASLKVTSELLHGVAHDLSNFNKLVDRIAASST